jgi:hypothetical protein
LTDILKLTRWNRRVYERKDGDRVVWTVALEVRRPSAPMGQRFISGYMQGLYAAAKHEDQIPKIPEDANGTPVRQRTSLELGELIALASKGNAALYEEMPPGHLEWAFREFVRNVECSFEDEDGPVTTGERLLEVADHLLTVWVLNQIRDLSSLTALEGKVSSSPSTSGSEGAPPSEDSGAYPVPNTVGDSSTGEASTATPPPN